MTTIALHEYLDQINQMLEDGQPEQAGAHCRHILQQHPRHVATYRLLAKALLELEEYRGAKELFQRILSADPNDYISHVGLSDVYKQEEILTQALWHLERAYEIEPHNGAVQDELRKLYLAHLKRERNGRSAVISPAQLNTLPLTDGALARLYLRGELYDQAAELLRTALAEDENRVDLRVLLLEVLWRDDHRMEAVTVGLQLLDELPNCIVANAILAEIWLRTGRIEEAQVYLRRVQTLTMLDAMQADNDSPVGYAFRAEGAPALPEETLVDYLDSGMLLADEDAITPISRPLPLPQENGATAVAPLDEDEDNDIYGWLQGIAEEPEPEEGRGKETAVSSLLSSDWFDEPISPAEAEAPADRTAAHTPDFADLDWLEKELRTEPGPANNLPESGAEPDWLADLSVDDLEPLQLDALAWAPDSKSDDRDLLEADSDEADFDWLDSLAQEDDDLILEAGEIDVAQFALKNGAEAETFEWRLTDELSTPGKDDQQEKPPVSEGDTPELISGSLDRAAQAAQSTGTLDIPDWLMGQEEFEEIEDDRAFFAAEVENEFADWVAAQNADLQTEFESSELLEETAVKDPDDEIDWSGLLADPAPVTPPESEPLQTGDLPDWLRGDALDLPDSAPLIEPTPAGADELKPTTSEQETPEISLVWPTAEFDQIEPFSDKMTTDDTAEVSKIAESFVQASVDVEDAVSDDKEEMTTGPQNEAENWLGDTDNLLDWLDDLADLSDEDAIAEAADALPDWLQNQRPDGLAALVASVEPEEETDPDLFLAEDDALMPGATAVADDNLDWLDALADTGLDAESADELPTWQWPDAQPEWEDTPEAEALPAFDLAAAADDDDSADFSFATAERLEPAEDFPDDLDDAMAWLEQLASDPDAPVEELPSVATRLDQEELAEATLAASPADALPDEADELAFPPEDPDEAMAWLEQLAARQGAPLDELPFVSDLAVIESEEEAEEEAEALESFSLDVPDDPDEAMAWLEQLAARQGAPLDELPSIEKAPLAEESADEMLEAWDSILETDTWLEEEMGEERPFATESPAILEPADDSDTADLAAAIPDDLEEAMAWLEQLAARQGAPLDELPSISEEGWAAAVSIEEEDEEAEILAEFDFFAAESEATGVESGDGALDWLADLTEGASLSEDMAPTAGVLPGDEAISKDEPSSDDDDWFDFFAGEVGESPDWLDDLKQPVAPLPDERLLAELDWLEAMGGLSAETTSLDELAEITIDEAELADALDRLEALATQPVAPPESEQTEPEEALPVEEIPFIAEDYPDLDEGWLVPGVQESLVEAAEDTSSEGETAVAEMMFDANLLDTIPDDPDAAMAWLEQLAARQGAPLDELPSLTEEQWSDLIVDKEEEAVVAVEETTTAVTETDLPEDIEDMMAWLEQLAARQGASLEELPTVTDAKQEIVTPAWIVAAQAAAESEARDATEAEDDFASYLADLPFALADDMDAEEETAVGQPAEALAEALAEAPAEALAEAPATAEPEVESLWADIEMDPSGADLIGIAELSQEFDEIDDSLPDWLSSEEEDDRILGHTDWLDALPEPDLDSWLAAEEEVTASSLAEATSDYPPLPEVVTSPLVEPKEFEDDLLLADFDFAASAVELDQTRLRTAQRALAAGEFETAIADYSVLVEAGEGLNLIIADLETAARQHKDSPLLRRTLGDAYVRNGQLQRALDSYRQALNQL